jgi:hypothetical protein
MSTGDRLFVSAFVPTYDIFEVTHAGKFWKTSVPGHDAAIARALQLAIETPNEIRVLHLESDALIMSVRQFEPQTRTE